MPNALIVDDSKTMLMSLQGLLAKNGYQVASANDGQEALDKLKGGEKPNVIITDLNMPRMDGITLIKEARKLPALRFTPILMLTTESQETKRAEAKAAGATGWLVKPVAPDDLTQVLKQVVLGS